MCHLRVVGELAAIVIVEIISRAEHFCLGGPVSLLMLGPHEYGRVVRELDTGCVSSVVYGSYIYDENSRPLCEYQLSHIPIYTHTQTHKRARAYIPTGKSDWL
jgi:hypothetical protein